MFSFGRKLRECREEKGLSQAELARRLGTNHSLIGKYEREEVRPAVDVVMNLAKELGTTVSYLLGETSDTEILRDPNMLKRLNDISQLPQEDRHCILYTIDGLLRDAKTRLAYS